MKKYRAKSQHTKPQGQRSSFAVIGGCLPVLRGLLKWTKKRMRLAERIEINAAARRENDTALRYEHHKDALYHVVEKLRAEIESAKKRQPEDNNPAQTPEGQRPGGCL